ncbi:MAG: YceI family protein [Acidimicrobiales bacterium]
MQKRLLIAGSVVGVLAVIGVGLAWWLGLFDEPEAEVSLAESAALVAEEGDATTSAVAPTTSTEDSTESTTTAPTDATEETTTTTTTDAGPIDDLTGTWSVVPSDATFVGYRVDEVLGGVGDFTAVGRTAGVTGELVGNGLTIESVSILADLTLLVSDNGARDAQMRRQGLETNDFPEASFVLTAPIVLSELPAEGATINATADGELTLHGVTRAIQVTIDGQIVGGRLLVVGSTEIAMIDYDIDPPRAPVVASVDEIGIMEFSLVFARA